MIPLILRRVLHRRGRQRLPQASSSPFYSDSWKVGTVPFRQSVAYFETLIANYVLPAKGMDNVEALNASVSDLSEKYDTLRSELDDKFQTLRSMLESLMLAKSSASPKPKATQAPPPLEPQPIQPYSLIKTHASRTERWNQADLGYFDPHFDRAHGEGEIVSLGKEVYYQNLVLFVQRIQSIVIFKGAALVKANIATSIRGSALEWYTSELDDRERETFNEDLGVDAWVATLSQGFKVPSNVALGLLAGESYTLDDARQRRPSAQYVRAIIRHGIFVTSWMQRTNYSLPTEDSRRS